MNEENRLGTLIFGIAMFLLGLGTLVTGLFPLGRGAGWVVGPIATVLSVVALFAGVLFVYRSVQGLMRPSHKSLLGEPTGPEEGLRILAQQYADQGNRKESLKTLIMLYERQRDYEKLEAVQKELRELQRTER